MKTRQAVLLTILLAAGVFLAYRQMTKPPPGPAEPLQVVEPPPAHVIDPLTRRLPDGSFHPNPPSKRQPGDDPAELVNLGGWRERYAAALADQIGDAERTRFYIYPFLDSTTKGVGITSTYGAHLAGGAALAWKTDAQLVGDRPPERYGSPRIDPDDPAARPGFDSWLQTAWADPATEGAQYVICGQYTDGDNPDQIRVRVVLTESAADAAPREIYAGQVEGGDFNLIRTLSNLQREYITAIVRETTASGLARLRPAASDPSLDLERELDDVAMLFDSNDSWTVMDGVDRSLQLAALFPAETLPMQAAAYGINVLARMLFDYVGDSFYRAEYALRSHALSQAALGVDPDPSLSQMNWAYSLVMLGYDWEEVLGGVTYDDRTARYAELAALRSEIIRSREALLGPEMTEIFPDWQVLTHENRVSYFRGGSPWRIYLEDRTAHWLTSDFFAMALLVQGSSSSYLPRDSIDASAEILEASARASRLSMASEIASLMVVLDDPADRAQLLEAALAGGRMNAVTLRDLAGEADYYGLRRELLAGFQDWEPPDDPDHPLYQMLPTVDRLARRVMADGTHASAASGMFGFEFTPAQRVRLYRRLDGAGPSMLNYYYISLMANQRAFLRVASQYERARPDNADFQYTIAYTLTSRFYANANAEARAARDEALARVLESYPLNPALFFQLGSSEFQSSNVEYARAILAHYDRSNRFSPFRLMNLATLAETYGSFASAADFFDQFYNRVPTRHDMKRNWAKMQCQMGNAGDPDVRAAFANPQQWLAGASVNHVEYINYLTAWLEDWDGARQAAAFYHQVKGPVANIARARVEILAGDFDAAKAYLNQSDLSGEPDGARAARHAEIAELYLDMGDLQQAEAHLERGDSFRANHSALVLAWARLELEKGNIPAALAGYERSRLWYGNRQEVVLGLASCHERDGDPDAALQALERWNSALVWVEEIRLHAQQLDRESARAVIEEMVASRYRRRPALLAALEHYRELDADHAAELMGRLDEIMAGPPFLGR